MRLALALVLISSVADADPLPHEFDDLGACLATEYVGQEVLRVFVYERDDKQRLRKETITFHGVTGATSYSYDARGRLATSSDDDGARTTFEYDAKGKLTRTLRIPSSSTTPTLIQTFRYDAKGRHVGTTESITGTSMKLERAYTYNAAGRLDTIRIGSMVSTMAYDATGLLVRTEEREASRPKRDRALTYKYDAKQRRIEETSPTGHTEYRYDCKPRD